mmetsp:Transcript_23750/g.80185  ORF Transcript_23750/g.80185 Transcript_23750/m.80185 type:complete len:312 (+) Transcript_23750:379-1314(+)
MTDGAKGPSGTLLGSSRRWYGSQRRTTKTSALRCTANCATMDTLGRSSKTLRGGRFSDNSSRGAAREARKKSIAVSRPTKVICVSPCFTPARYKLESMYAETRHMRARILKTWSMVTRVQRPWRTMTTQQPMDDIFEANGDAMEASPSLTSLGSRSSRSSAAAKSAAPSAASDTPTCARFSAPTSLVPSPHISVVRPEALSVATTSSLPSGRTRANTTATGHSAAAAAAPQASKASPRTTMSCVAARPARPSKSKGKNSSSASSASSSSDSSDSSADSSAADIEPHVCAGAALETGAAEAARGGGARHCSA